MVAYLKFKLALSRFFRQKSKLRSAYAKDIAAAYKEKKKSEDIRRIEHDEQWEVSMLDEEISILVTSYLVSKALRRFIAIPSHETDGMWEQCNKVSERWVLQMLAFLCFDHRCELKQRIVAI